MKKKLIPVLIISLLVNWRGSVFGQGFKNNFFNKHPLDISVGNFSVGLPFSKIVINDYYPFIALGTEFYYRDKKHSQFYQTVKIGGYYGKYSTSSLFVNTEIGYRHTLGLGFFTDLNLGVGYSHLFRPNAIYKLDSNDTYEQVRDWGKPSLMANYAMSIGFDFGKNKQLPMSIFLRYANYVQLLYNADLPVLPQNSLQIGARFLINSKHTKK